MFLLFLLFLPIFLPFSGFQGFYSVAGQRGRKPHGQVSNSLSSSLLPQAFPIANFIASLLALVFTMFERFSCSLIVTEAGPNLHIACSVTYFGYQSMICDKCWPSQYPWTLFVEQNPRLEVTSASIRSSIPVSRAICLTTETSMKSSI